ncbi:MAG: hypothetical protein PWR22_465 [Moorella sp. (in: firmicutes)]|nr:hypothetical protein [Moorella sp. (in: firmicutes)]MDK2893883.1 hypothetical protein [Moorella sp. (in: firmicutes)]
MLSTSWRMPSLTYLLFLRPGSYAPTARRADYGTFFIFALNGSKYILTVFEYILHSASKLLSLGDSRYRVLFFPDKQASQIIKQGVDDGNYDHGQEGCR